MLVYWRIIFSSYFLFFRVSVIYIFCNLVGVISTARVEPSENILYVPPCFKENIVNSGSSGQNILSNFVLLGAGFSRLQLIWAEFWVLRMSRSWLHFSFGWTELYLNIVHCIRSKHVDHTSFTYLCYLYLTWLIDVCTTYV